MIVLFGTSSFGPCAVAALSPQAGWFEAGRPTFPRRLTVEGSTGARAPMTAALASTHMDIDRAGGRTKAIGAAGPEGGQV